MKARERRQGLVCAAGAVYAHARRAGGVNSTLDEATRVTLPCRVQHIGCTPASPARGGSGQRPEVTIGLGDIFTRESGT